MRSDISQLHFIDKRLRVLCDWLERETGLEFTITSIYRPDDPGSVHGKIPVRGIDLRCKSRSIGLMIESMVNAAWSYDPERPEMRACIYHDVGQGAHLHLQSHPNTRRSP